MFEIKRRDTTLHRAFAFAELVFHATVRDIRKGNRTGLGAIIMAVVTSVIFIATFYFMFELFELRKKGFAIRGDFILYLMSGIFLFMSHIKAMGAVLGAEGPTSAMMKHAPMNTGVAITSAALSSLYTQTISMFIILFASHTLLNPIEIYNWGGTALMFLLAWFTGVAVGLIFLGMKPWAPKLVSVLSQIYSRMNMIASGKMVVANSLPPTMLMLFDWNPLFHTIDQARGFTFINYNPHNSNWEYALKVWLALAFIGLLGEFYTRRHASLSWSAGR